MPGAFIEVVTKKFQCDESPEARIFCLVDNAHTAASQFFDDSIVRYSLTDECLRASHEIPRNLGLQLGRRRFLHIHSAFPVTTEARGHRRQNPYRVVHCDQELRPQEKELSICFRPESWHAPWPYLCIVLARLGEKLGN